MGFAAIDCHCAWIIRVADFLSPGFSSQYLHGSGLKVGSHRAAAAALSERIAEIQNGKPAYEIYRMNFFITTKFMHLTWGRRFIKLLGYQTLVKMSAVIQIGYITLKIMLKRWIVTNLFERLKAFFLQGFKWSYQDCKQIIVYPYVVRYMI